MFRACGALPALGYRTQQHRHAAFDTLRAPRLKSGPPTIGCGSASPSPLLGSIFNPEGSTRAGSKRLQCACLGGSGGSNGGNSGGWNGGGGGNGDDGGNGDGNDFFSGVLVLFLAGIPFIVDSARRWSFGADGIRVMHLSGEEGMPKPVFAAVAMGTPARPPAPAAESMSGGGGAGSCIGGVLAILLLCAGGFYIVNKKKGGSGAPGRDDDEEALQMEPIGDVGTRSLDPTLLQRPPAAGTSEPMNVEEKSHVEPAPPSTNPLVDHMDEKDNFFVKEGPSAPPAMAAIPAPSSAPPAQAAPPADITPKQPTPDQVVKDLSATYLEPMAVDFGAKPGNYFAVDLSAKDNMFGRPAEPDMAPLKPGTSTVSHQKPVASSSKPASTVAPLPGAVTPNDFLQQQIEKDNFFSKEGRSDVEVCPISAPTSFGDAAVPKAPSTAAKVVGNANAAPEDVVKLYDSMPHEHAFVQKSGSASLLKEMEDKDSMFAEKPVTEETITVESADVEIPRQILDVVSDPIMTDIAKQLQGKEDSKQMVGVGLDVAGDTVALKLNFSCEDTGKAISEYNSSSPSVAGPSTPTADPPSKAVPEDTIQSKTPEVEVPKAHNTSEDVRDGEQDEHEDDGVSSPHEGSGTPKDGQTQPKKKKRTRRGKKKPKNASA